ncbi:MAG TPA: phosphoglycerate dehydrogenase [Kofleriaceae bacterium]|nr:phosphoglycerate dehydrogenase [Kofleriaceae bacterium]
MTARIVAISTSSFAGESSAPLDLLRERGFEVRMNPHGRQLTPDESSGFLADVVGLIAGTEKLSGDLLRANPALKCISRVGVGMDNVDHAAARELGIAVHNTPEAHVDAVAELTLAGLLGALRLVPDCHAGIRAGTWKKPMGRLLRGKTIGLVGFGRVGRAFARLLAPFECPMVAVDPERDPRAAASTGARYVEMGELLAVSDVVSLHLPYAASARHIIGAAELAAMRDDAVLVNTSRGGLVDEDALAAHLAAHPRALAYLDCFEQEPYKGPLRALPGCFMTAHIGSYAREARERMELEAATNLLRALGSA